MNHLKFKHPFTSVVCGPTSSGKTTFVRQLIENYRCTTTLETECLNLLWCYGTWQSTYELKFSSNVSVTYYDGIPSREDVERISPHFVVLDDLMFEVARNTDVAKLFTMYSHHNGISVIFITQNMTFKGKGIIEINRNTMYIILFKNNRDSNIQNTIAQQVFREDKRHFKNVFTEVTSVPYGYLVIDCHPTTPAECMLKSKVIPEDGGRTQADIFYKEKSDLEKLKTLFASVGAPQ